MARFVALVSNPLAAHAEADRRALAEAVERGRPTWSPVFDAGGLRIYAPPPRSRADACLTLSDGGGAIMGAIFAKGDATTASASDLAHVSEPAHLFSQWWGRYVAFLADSAGACVHVARDPSGAMPCFVARRGWVYVFFSYADDIDALGLDPGIDWIHIAERLSDNRSLSLRTGLAQVEELAPGACARVGQGRCTVTQVWRECDLAAKAQFLPHDEAVARLRVATELACVGLSGLYDSVGLRLSGGLDSAIVLGSLKRAPRFALNWTTPTTEGDERDYARAASESAATQLIIKMRDPERVDLAAAAARATGVRPPLWLAEFEIEHEEDAIAHSEGIGAYLGGRGGDNVFFRSERAHALADLAVARGIGPTLVAALRAQARAKSKTMRAVAGDLVAIATQRDQVSEWAPFLSAKARGLLQDGRSASECRPTSKLLAGKRLHLAMIADRRNYCEPHARIDYVYPLVAQPVLEACLATPTYVLSPPGNERGLARVAFADRVPPAIVSRRSKGQTTSYLMQVVLRQLDFLRGFLLHGACAEAGLIDRAQVAATLSAATLMRSAPSLGPVVSLLNVEAWLRLRGGQRAP